MKVTYYQILKIDLTATPDEIKKAYRKQSAKYHPDRNKDPNATLFMQAVNEAYACLSDVDKRQSYDYTLRTKQTTAQPSPKPTYKDPYEAYDREWWDEDYRRQRGTYGNAYDRMKEEVRDEEDRLWRDLERMKEEIRAMKAQADFLAASRDSKTKQSNYWGDKATDDYASRWYSDTVEPKQTASDKFFKFFSKK